MKIEVIGPRTGKYTGDLLSAAPELLACLLDVLDADGDLDAMDFNRYRAAVAKATGEKQCQSDAIDCSAPVEVEALRSALGNIEQALGLGHSRADKGAA